MPIPATVKRVFQDFKRTHQVRPPPHPHPPLTPPHPPSPQDNWAEHKLAFTEDQLAQLTDLLVSPSYYA